MKNSRKINREDTIDRTGLCRAVDKAFGPAADTGIKTGGAVTGS